MRINLWSFFRFVFFITYISLAWGCATGYTPVPGNEEGSAPLNEKEVNDYKRAVHQCYKTGGSRVVKVQGVLRCY